MSLRFKPYPGVTIAALITFAILCGLGSWQMQRLHWKNAIIAQAEANRSAAPITPDDAIALGDAAQYRPVRLNGRFDHAKESYAYVTAPGGGAVVYHVLTPFILDDGRVLMVDRGAVPENRRDPSTRADGNIEGPVTLTGVWRRPDPPNMFSAAPDLARRVWYVRDVVAMAAEDGLTLAAPVVVEADATPNPGGLPKGGQTMMTFRNQHLSYAVTWFGLAGTLLAVWLAYNITTGRVAWVRRSRL